MAKQLGLRGPLDAGVRGELGRIPVRWIPAGSFTMGIWGPVDPRLPGDGQHEVVLSRGFFLAETECTQDQWEAVMGSNPSHFKGADRPVEWVSWKEAVAFCRRLTEKQRHEGLLPEGWEWRLPTESEWEYAARAGSGGVQSMEVDSLAWHRDNSGNQSHAVGQKAANAWGLHDMLGNVSEWCGDWYGGYPLGSVTDPKGPRTGSLRVIRGGSCGMPPELLRLLRGRYQPTMQLVYIGFRPALCPVR